MVTIAAKPNFKFPISNFMPKFTIGILREEKIPPDNRVPLTPRQCHELSLRHPNLDIRVETSNVRCFRDDDYRKFGIGVQETVSDCDLLMGVKEVPVNKLITGKTYMFFSHTIKKQAHNKPLLQAILEKNITLIDYELLTDENGHRLIGFGWWAGIIGAHYALLMLGKKTGAYNLKPAMECLNLQELIDQYDEIRIPPAKFIVTGGGRVASGAIEIMHRAEIEEVSKADFFDKTFDKPVFVQLHSRDLYSHKDGLAFDDNHFYHNAGEYKSVFMSYLSKADVLIHCSYWDLNAMPLFTLNDLAIENFSMKIIADVSCDIPGPIPTTIITTSSKDPVYGYNITDGTIGKPYEPGTIDVMSIPNLPNELPRDASRDFGKILMDSVIPGIIHLKDDPTVNRAIIAKNGTLMPAFSYLEDWVKS